MTLSVDFKKLPVEELIALFANKNQEQAILDRAFTEFHDRYKNYIYSVCMNTSAVKSVFLDSEIQIIAFNALRSSYLGSATFKPAGKHVTEKGKHKRVCGWLGTITRNETLKYINKEKYLREHTIQTENIEAYAEFVYQITDEPEEYSPPPPEMVLLEEALSKISERDQEITFAYLMYEDEKGRMDPQIHKRLVKKYNLLTKYPAKIKNRTIEKLLLINPNNNPKPQIIQKHGNEKERSRITKAGGAIKRLPPRYGPDVSGDTGTG